MYVLNESELDDSGWLSLMWDLIGGKFIFGSKRRRRMGGGCPGNEWGKLKCKIK